MTDVKINANAMYWWPRPIMGGLVSTSYVHGLLDPYDAADRHGFGLEINFNSFDSLITRARNTMVAEYLADERFTHLMWIDGDIGFKGSDVVRLLLADRPVVAGVYSLKTDGWPAEGLPEALPTGMTKADFRARFACYPTTAISGELEPDENGFLDVIDAPTGFMLIKREVFLKLASSFPELHYRSDLIDPPDHDTGKMAASHYELVLRYHDRPAVRELSLRRLCILPAGGGDRHDTGDRYEVEPDPSGLCDVRG